MCSPSCVDLKPQDVVHDRVMMDEAYVWLSFLEHLLEPQEWIHALSTLDVCALPNQTKFYDLNGYNIIHIRMMNASRQKEHSKEDFHDAMSEMD